MEAMARIGDIKKRRARMAAALKRPLKKGPLWDSLCASWRADEARTLRNKVSVGQRGARNNLSRAKG